MRDYENPVHIPPLPLKILTVGLITCFVIAPLVMAIRAGNATNLLIWIPLGLASVALILGWMFVQRLLIWFVSVFYWYIAACGGAVLFFIALALIGGVLTFPTLPNKDQVSPLGNVFIAGGALLGIVALYLVFRRGSNTHPATPPPSPHTPSPEPTKQKRILDAAQQIAARKHDLGIDDKDKSN